MPMSGDGDGDDQAPGRLASAAAAVAIAVAYVAFLYAPPFHARGLPRDHPTTVFRRFAACGASCALALALFLAAAPLPPGRRAAARLLGLAPPRPWPAFFAPPMLALVPYLPTGCARLFATATARRRERGGQVSPPRRRCRPPTPLLLLARDLVVAPLTEEFAFRACLLPLLAPACGARLAPWIAPFLFSLAHAHHHLAPVWEVALNVVVIGGGALSVVVGGGGGGASLAAAAAAALPWLLLQLAYTYVFGLYASLMLVATGSLPGVVAAHALCNALGLPGGGKGGGRLLAAATVAATAAMAAAMAALNGGALDAARWYGGGLFAAP